MTLNDKTKEEHDTPTLKVSYRILFRVWRLWIIRWEEESKSPSIKFY